MKYLLSVILLVTLCRCTENTSTTMPFSYNKYGHIIIPIKVSDTIINFVFDTGSSMSSISNEQKPSKLKLTDSCIKIIVLSMMDTCIAKISEPVKIKFNNSLSQTDAKFAVFDTINDQLFSLIGMDVIKDFFWHFDFVNKAVTISTELLSVPEKSERLYYTMFDNKTRVSSAFYMLRVNDSTFFSIMDTGYAVNHIEYDSDSTKNIVADTNVILYYMVKDEDDIGKFAKRIHKSEPKKYYSYYQMEFDTLKMNQFINTNKVIGVWSHPKLPQAYDNRLFITLNFFKQFDQMYIDPKQTVVYLSNFEK